MKNIAILLSTYNGEKYIRKQLESLINQIDVNVEVFIRDDGSNDSTLRIIEEYKYKYKNIFLTRGMNVGPGLSFFELIKLAPNADLYAFSDQDDIWLENKLLEASKKISDYNSPVLYFSNEFYIDSTDKIIGVSKKNRIYNFPESLIRSNVIGCSIVFNKRFLNLIKKHYPKKIVMHDSYLFRLASILDVTMILDQNHYLKYRLHDNNYFGTTLGFYNKLSKHFLKRKKIFVIDDIQEILNGYSNVISKGRLNLLYLFLNYSNSYKNKIILLFNKNFTKTILQKVIFFINIISNIYA